MQDPELDQLRAAFNGAGDDRELSHLDDRLAAAFAEVGWRPADPDREPPPGQAPTGDGPERLAALLIELITRVDRLGHRMSERDTVMTAALEQRWATLAQRLDAMEQSLPAFAERVDAATVELERTERPMQQVAEAIKAVQASMRAQSRVLSSLYAAFTESPATPDAVAKDVALAREHAEALERRIDDLERWVVEIAGTQ